MVSISAECNASRLKLTHPQLFTDICQRHAGRLLGITDTQRIAELVGDIQGPVVDSLTTHTSVAAKRKPFKGIMERF